MSGEGEVHIYSQQYVCVAWNNCPMAHGVCVNVKQSMSTLGK